MEYGLYYLAVGVCVVLYIVVSGCVGTPYKGRWVGGSESCATVAGVMHRACSSVDQLYCQHAERDGEIGIKCGVVSHLKSSVLFGHPQFL